MLFAVDQIVVCKTEGSFQTDLYQLNLEREKNNVVIFKQKTIVELKRVHTIETKLSNKKTATRTRHITRNYIREGREKM